MHLEDLVHLEVKPQLDLEDLVNLGRHPALLDPQRQDQGQHLWVLEHPLDLGLHHRLLGKRPLVPWGLVDLYLQQDPLGP